MSFDALALAAIALPAAVVNGALGHGFSSITVPLALLLHTGRVLNPALVLVELVVNGYVLLVNRRSVPDVVGRARPILVGLVPGVLAGAWVLAAVDPVVLRLWVFAVLLPLILLQAAGVRRPLRSERAVGVPLGAGIGVLYAVTTISGPPLALLLNNQGLTRAEFRAALGLIRVAECSLTATVYLTLGLFTPATVPLVASLAPSVLVGIPLGALLVTRLDAETFRRLCMSFDAWIVGFGLARALLEHVPGAALAAHAVFIGAVLVDAVLLCWFFAQRRLAAGVLETVGTRPREIAR